MKVTFKLVIAVFIFSSCRKYKEDRFISTFRPEDRLKNTTNNTWDLNKFKDVNGNEKNIGDYNFMLKFNEDSIFISSLNQVFKSEYRWNFISNKKYLSINDNLKFEILQLEVNKLKLKNDKGQIYYFDKITKNDTSKVCDETVLNTPLFGMHNELSKSIKLVEVNHCEQNNITVMSNGNQVPSPIVKGLFGNGFGYSFIYSNPVSYSFSKSFSKIGYVTFYSNRSDIKVKINNVPVGYESARNLYKNTDWFLIKILVPNTGNNSFQIDTPYSSIIDEIKFWEIE